MFDSLRVQDQPIHSAVTRRVEQMRKQRPADPLAAPLALHRHPPDVTIRQQASGSDCLAARATRQDMQTERIPTVVLHFRRNALLGNENRLPHLARRLPQCRPVALLDTKLGDIHPGVGRNQIE